MAEVHLYLVYLETRTLNFRLTGTRDPESRKGAVASPEEVAENAHWIQNHRRQPLVEEGFELRTVECPRLRRPQARILESDNQFKDYLRKYSDKHYIQYMPIICINM